jgi:lambda family phage portal protein
MGNGILSGISIDFNRNEPPEAMTPARVNAFDIGRSGRRLSAIPSVQSAINALIAGYGNQAVARSRYLALNNPYAIAAKETFVSALVGDGIKPSKVSVTAEEKKKLAEVFADWAPYADADGVLDFYGLQTLAAGELFEAGECFAVFDEPATSEDGIVPLAIRLYQSEMLPYWETTVNVAGGNRVEMGIEFDANNRRVAYHFLQRHPGDFQTPPAGLGTIRIPAERVMHLYRPIRVGQIRGIPHTLAGMVTLAMMDLYDDAELERKRTTALFAGFITSEDTDDDESPLGALSTVGSLVGGVPGSGNPSITLEPGVMVPLGPGEDVTFSNPADLGNSYEPFQYRMLLRAAAGFGVPYSSFTGDMRQVNYSSMRAGLLDFRRRVTAMQKAIMIQGFCRPFWNQFIKVATAQGLAPWTAAAYATDKPLYHRVKWLPPKFDWVDPLKDIQAEKAAVDEGFKARSDVIEEGGDDPEATDERIHADRLRADGLATDLGGPLYLSAPAAPPPPPPGFGGDDPDDPDAPAEEEEEDEDEDDPVTGPKGPQQKPPGPKPAPPKKGA